MLINLGFQSSYCEKLFCVSGKDLEFAVMFSDYDGRLVDLNSLRISAVVKVKETNKIFADQYDFRLDNKDVIDIKVMFFESIHNRNLTVSWRTNR